MMNRYRSDIGTILGIDIGAIRGIDTGAIR